MRTFDRILRLAVLAGAVTLTSPGSAATPSFLCKQVKSWVEITICGSATLAQRDLDLAFVRARLLKAIGPTPRAAMEREQHRWWSGLNGCRKASDPIGCLAGRYDERIAAIRDHPDYPGDVRAPVRDLEPAAIATAGQGWTRHLSEYQRALRACGEEAPEPIGKLLVAWTAGDPDTIGLRLVDWNLKEWVCVAHRSGHKVFRYDARVEGESLPAAGPVYHLGGKTPPPRCSNATQVVDVNGKPVGWISDRDC